MELTYREILGIKDYLIEFQGDPQILDQEVRGISISSQKIQPEEIFVAIKGEKFDGHDFVAEVFSKGAKLCIVGKEWYQKQDETVVNGNFFIVEDTLTALQNLSRYYRLKFEMPVIALTGSNGKTTTKEMIAAVLETKYRVLKNPGNLNNHIGLPLTLFGLNRDQDITVLEMGANHFGEIARLAEIACPEYGLITNIGPAHLEFFGNLEGVFKAKSELWEYLEKNGEGVFINVDDPFLSRSVPSVKKVIRYGFENRADVQGKVIEIDNLGRAKFMADRLEIKLQVAGIHNIYNAIAAIAVGREFDVTDQDIKTSLESFQAADKRMEILQIGEIRIINDCYNSNPESAKYALATLSRMQISNKRIAVLSDMLELGDISEKEHTKIGEYVNSLKNIDYLLTYGKFSQYTAAAAKAAGMANVYHFEDKKELTNYLKNILESNDLILIKGSRGMVMEEVTREIVKNN